MPSTVRNQGSGFPSMWDTRGAREIGVGWDEAELDDEVKDRNRGGVLGSPGISRGRNSRLEGLEPEPGEVVFDHPRITNPMLKDVKSGPGKMYIPPYPSFPAQPPPPAYASPLQRSASVPGGVSVNRAGMMEDLPPRLPVDGGAETRILGGLDSSAAPQGVRLEPRKSLVNNSDSGKEGDANSNAAVGGEVQDGEGPTGTHTGDGEDVPKRRRLGFGRGLARLATRGSIEQRSGDGKGPAQEQGAQGGDGNPPPGEAGEDAPGEELRPRAGSPLKDHGSALLGQEYSSPPKRLPVAPPGLPVQGPSLQAALVTSGSSPLGPPSTILVRAPLGPIPSLTDGQPPTFAPAPTAPVPAPLRPPFTEPDLPPPPDSTAISEKLESTETEISELEKQLLQLQTEATALEKEGEEVRKQLEALQNLDIEELVQGELLKLSIKQEVPALDGNHIDVPEAAICLPALGRTLSIAEPPDMKTIIMEVEEAVGKPPIHQPASRSRRCKKRAYRDDAGDHTDQAGDEAWFADLLPEPNAEDLQLHNKIFSENRKRVRLHKEEILSLMPEDVSSRMATGEMLVPMFPDVNDCPGYQEAVQRHPDVKEALLKFLRERQYLVRRKEQVLAAVYKAHAEDCMAYHAENVDKRRSWKAAEPISHRSRSGYLGEVRSEYSVERTAELLGALDTLRDMSFSTPAMMLDPWERRWKMYINRNGLVEDPVQELKEDFIGKDWTVEEKQIFRDKFLQHPKDFKAISNSLEHRTMAECIVFFYKHQKTEEFTALKRKQQLRKRKFATDNKRHLYASAPLTYVGSARLEGPSRGRGRGRGGRGRGRGKLEAAPSHGDEDLQGIVGDGLQSKRSIDDLDLIVATPGRWSAPEEEALVEAVKLYGRDPEAIATYLGGKRSAASVKWYFGRHKGRLRLDELVREKAAGDLEDGREEETLSADEKLDEEEGGDEGHGVEEKVLDGTTKDIPGTTPTTGVLQDRLKVEEAEDDKDSTMEDEADDNTGKVLSPVPAFSSPPGVGQMVQPPLFRMDRASSAFDHQGVTSPDGATPSRTSLSFRHFLHPAYISPDHLPSPSVGNPLGPPQYPPHLAAGRGSSPHSFNIEGPSPNSRLSSKPPSLFASMTMPSAAAREGLLPPTATQRVPSSPFAAPSYQPDLAPDFLTYPTQRRGAVWSAEERERFMEVFQVHGRNWEKLMQAIPGKSLSQIKTYYQNYKSKLGLDKIEPTAGAPPSARRGRAKAVHGTSRAVTPPPDSSEKEEMLDRRHSSGVTLSAREEGLGSAERHPVTRELFSDVAPGNVQRAESGANGTNPYDLNHILSLAASAGANQGGAARDHSILSLLGKLPTDALERAIRELDQKKRSDTPVEQVVPPKKEEVQLFAQALSHGDGHEGQDTKVSAPAPGHSKGPAAGSGGHHPPPPASQAGFNPPVSGRISPLHLLGLGQVRGPGGLGTGALDPAALTALLGYPLYHMAGAAHLQSDPLALYSTLLAKNQLAALPVPLSLAHLQSIQEQPTLLASLQAAHEASQSAGLGQSNANPSLAPNRVPTPKSLDLLGAHAAAGGSEVQDLRSRGRPTSHEFAPASQPLSQSSTGIKHGQDSGGSGPPIKRQKLEGAGQEDRPPGGTGGPPQVKLGAEYQAALRLLPGADIGGLGGEGNGGVGYPLPAGVIPAAVEALSLRQLQAAAAIGQDMGDAGSLRLGPSDKNLPSLESLRDAAAVEHFNRLRATHQLAAAAAANGDTQILRLLQGGDLPLQGLGIGHGLGDLGGLLHGRNLHLLQSGYATSQAPTASLGGSIGEHTRGGGLLGRGLQGHGAHAGAGGLPWGLSYPYAGAGDLLAHRLELSRIGGAVNGLALHQVLGFGGPLGGGPPPSQHKDSNPGPS